MHLQSYMGCGQADSGFVVKENKSRLIENKYNGPYYNKETVNKNVIIK